MTRALLGVEDFSGTIWEPACGDGAMSRVLEEFGYKVFSSDIEPRNYGECVDFLSAKSLAADNIVTNPPFKLLNEFIVQAASFYPKKIALLAKIAALATQERSHILEETHLTRVHIFRARQTIWRNGIVATNNGGTMEYCWMVRERGYKGKPQIGWV